jgi:hypothetical protein
VHKKKKEEIRRQGGEETGKNDMKLLVFPT